MSTKGSTHATKNVAATSTKKRAVSNHASRKDGASVPSRPARVRSKRDSQDRQASKPGTHTKRAVSGSRRQVETTVPAEVYEDYLGIGKPEVDHNSWQLEEVMLMGLMTTGLLMVGFLIGHFL